MEDKQSPLDPSFCDPLTNLFETTGNPLFLDVIFKKYFQTVQSKQFHNQQPNESKSFSKTGVLKQSATLPQGKPKEPLFGRRNPPPEKNSHFQLQNYKNHF